MAQLKDIALGTEVDETEAVAPISGLGANVTIALTKADTCRTYTGIANNSTIALSGGNYSNTFKLYLINDGVSARTITWGSGITGPSSSATLVVSKMTRFLFEYVNGTWYLVHQSVAL